MCCIYFAIIRLNKASATRVLFHSTAIWCEFSHYSWVRGWPSVKSRWNYCSLTWESSTSIYSCSFVILFPCFPLFLENNPHSTVLDIREKNILCTFLISRILPQRYLLYEENNRLRAVLTFEILEGSGLCQWLDLNHILRGDDGDNSMTIYGLTDTKDDAVQGFTRIHIEMWIESWITSAYN